ncbi:MAG: peptidoglycan recognition family protein [Deltaproteobacteria bacterium]|nr:peptidoglycan recognition family protein [Deltaproteobacteria bacterium]
MPPPPPVIPRLLPYLDERREQTAEYSLRHYGTLEAALRPQVVVLHYTCGPSFRSAWHTFANNRPRRGELPGLCAHYIVDQDGSVYGLVPPTMRCRHANGLNHVAIGIEFVQSCLREGPAAVEHAMLTRGPQIEAALALVRHLRFRYNIRDEDIIGHAMVNRHRLFSDLLGRNNDHGDWRTGAVLQFRQRL